MMGKSWVLCGLIALAMLSSVRSECADIEKYFGDVSSVTEIDLGDVIRVDCPGNEDGGYLEEILIESGKTLTIKSTQTFVRFVNVRFTVMEGATVVFDIPVTRFGPNSEYTEGGMGYMLEVSEGASVTFMGKFRGSQVVNIRSIFYNSGTIDFKGDALFNNSGSIFRSNLGTLKFRGDAVFKNNRWVALKNDGPDAYVRFSKTATFDTNGGSFDGSTGCAVANLEGTVIFRDEATFSNHLRCDEGPAVFNSGKMRFYGKTYFNDNNNQGEDGGGMRNRDGTLVFKAAVQFTRNEAQYGGGLAISGGDVTFNKAVLFESNQADYSGGAFALTGGSLTFEKPEVVRVSNNTIVDNVYVTEPRTGCSLAYVEEEDSTLIGFDFDDICVEVTV